MFNIGDKVVYPSQGIGIIDVIEEKELKGEKIKCYIMHLINNTMKLTLPISAVNTFNIRLVSDIKTLENSLKDLDRFMEEAEKFSKINYKERRNISKIKMKSGTFDEFIEVIFDLTQLKRWHSLNSSEKQMLNHIKKIVVEEIAQAKCLTSDEASELLDLSMNLKS